MSKTASSFGEAFDAFQQLVATGDVPALGPRSRASALPAERILARVDGWLRERGIGGGKAEALRAAALLWHDHLHEAHGKAQGMADADGSFLHAIMHRREPDYWNSKYWWNRVGDHPAFRPLAGRVLELLTARQDTELACHLLPGGRWDPGAFVEACESAAEERHDSPLNDLLRAIQALEFECFVNHILRGT